MPGIQGGPLMHIIAGKAVAFGEALQPAFVQYSKQIVINAQTLAKNLLNLGYDIVMNGYELGGGSIRIHDAKLQAKIFHLLGVNDRDADEKFRFLIDISEKDFVEEEYVLASFKSLILDNIFNSFEITGTEET